MKETARRWTYQDYLLFPEDGKRYEVIDGEKFVTPAPIPRHQMVLLRLTYALLRFVEKMGLGGQVFFSPIDVLLAEDSVVQPDLLFIARERLSIIGEKAILGAPDLVIEVSSPSTRSLDSLEKRRLYAAHGVREYWVVDPDLERVEVFVLEGAVLEKRAEVTVGQAGSPAVLPGFAVDLKEVFG